MEFRVLGPLEVHSGGEVLPVRAATQRSLLAALLLSPNQVVGRGRLWGQAPPPSALANLRSHVGRLRRALAAGDSGGTRIMTRSGGYLIVLESGELDLNVFEELVVQGKHAARRDQHLVAAKLFGQALGLWRGVALDNVTTGGDVEAEVARLSEARLAVTEDYLRARLACGEHAEVISQLHGLAREHPLREPFWALLMLALHRAGRQADALAAYERARTLLVDELGLDPGLELRELHQRILTDDPSLPPFASAVSRCDLPGDIGDFTGREPELWQLLAAVRASHQGEGARAVAISAIDGMAGIGKTALAVRLAHQLTPHYPDGQLFVDLCAHTPGHRPLTSAAALGKLLRAAGVPGERIPEDSADRAALWRATLAQRRVLIVLDNAADSAQIRPLLPGTAGCLVLVTSRRRLADLDGTHLLSLDVLPAEDAVALFNQAVGDTRPATEPEAVAEVLALCGYLPLAIRIAAARLRHRTSWTVTQLAGRLRDQQRLAELHGEDRSVTVAFSLSYQHLTLDQQYLFRLLGLHPGPDIDPYAASALAAVSPSRAEDLLEDLVDAHLIQQPTAGRYRFHDLLRTYAAQLARSEEADADRRAALTRLFDHYLGTASTATELVMPTGLNALALSTPAVVMVDQGSAWSWLGTELANLLATAAHAADHGRPAQVCDFSTVLARYLDFRAYYEDALALHNQALTISRRINDPVSESRALHIIGRVHWWLGHYQDALNHAEQALTIARATGDRTVEGYALQGLGLILWRLGRGDEAFDCLRQALTIALDTGNRVLESYARHGLGLTCWQLTRYDDALEHAELALAIARETGDRIVEGYTLHGLVLAHWGLGRYQDALDHGRQALAVARSTGDRIVQSHALYELGRTYSKLGRGDEALDCLGQALTIIRDTEYRVMELDVLRGLFLVNWDLGNYQDALASGERGLAIARDTGDPVTQGFFLHGLGCAYRRLGRHEDALDSLRQALAIARHTGQRALEAQALNSLGSVETSSEASLFRRSIG